ncbi:MAG: alpha/beta hydrolase [Micrococcales bacterium]
MARARIDFWSEALGLNTSMTVIYPQAASTNLIGMGGADIDGDIPVLYLLHGLSDDDTIWERRTSIERYVSELGIAVVMPQVHRSFYSNMELGLPYWDYISTEVPNFARQMLRISSKREDNFLAGLSMGGYGAFKLALRNPERYAAAASLSGALGLSTKDQVPDFGVRDFELIFNRESIVGSNDDVMHLLTQSDPETRPKLFLACGTEDFLWQENVDFMNLAEKLGVPLEIHTGPGDHDWAYWDARIQDVLAWLPIRGK